MIETEECGSSFAKECRFNHFKTGERDNTGQKIEQVVYLKPNEYIIYFVEGEYLRPYYIDADDFFAPFSESFQKKLSQIKTINIKNEKQNDFVRKEIASAYHDELCGYHEVAIGQLDAVKSKLVYRAYVWWFTTYVSLCLFFVIIAVTWHIIAIYPSLNCLFYAMMASSIGGLLSHARKDSQDDIALFLPSVAAFIYFFASIGSGFLIYCILKSNLLLGEFGNDYFTMMLICFVAGYSEDIPLKFIDKITSIINVTVDRTREKPKESTKKKLEESIKETFNPK